MSLTADVADGKTGYQSSADANGISGGSENVCICTFLIHSGGHQSQRLPLLPQLRPCCVIKRTTYEVIACLQSLWWNVKVWVRIMHVNSKCAFKLWPKLGLHVIHKQILWSNIYGNYNLNLWSDVWGQMYYIRTAVFTSINWRSARSRMCSVSRVTQCS